MYYVNAIRMAVRLKLTGGLVLNKIVGRPRASSNLLKMVYLDKNVLI